MPFTRRRIWTLAIALLSLLLLTLFLAPGGNNGQLRQGSTYGRSPDGYGAWYAYMAKRGSIQRWQKPLAQLNQVSTKMTLLRVSSDADLLDIPDHNWVERGNVVVLLGAKAPVTRAPFSSDVPSPSGPVRIETSRRDPKGQPLLADSLGAIVWQQAIGQGRVIYAATPFLAANAYQDVPGNFEYLANLVTENGHPLWVDEYLHGYKDSDVQQQETSGSLIGYLARTPLSLLAMQALIILAVLIFGQNQRLGRAIALPSPTVDNSEAYIQAMAAVLHKAECSDFVVETLTKSEQIQIQSALGLGVEPLPLEPLVANWVQQTGRSAAELEAVLKPRPRRISEADLLKWLEDLQAIRRKLPPVR